MRTNGDKKARVMQQFPWTLEFTVYDLVMMHQLSREVVARVELDTYGTADNYPGMRVTILNKVTGKVDSKYFLFNDYFTGTSRVVNPEAAKNCGFYVWGYDWEWYLNFPDQKSLKDYVTSVQNFILEFDTGKGG